MPTTVRRRRRRRRHSKPVGKRKRFQMSETVAEANLIDEIDARQNLVLEELDTLNSKIEELLKDCATDREREESKAAEKP